MVAMSKKDRLQAAVAGAALDRVPVALWRHFPSDDQRGADLAAAVLAWQREYDFDLVKVTPSSDYCLVGWGTESAWQGGDEGTRRYTHHPILEAHQWRSLKEQEPQAGAQGEVLEALRLIGAGLGDATPFIQTIFSPISQAKNLTGGRLFTHMRQHPDDLLAGLETVTSSTLRFIREAKKLGIAGIFYACQLASSQYVSRSEYERFGKPFDLQILQVVQDCGFNLLHLHGSDVYFDLFGDYPVQAINWHDRETPPTLAEALSRFPGALCGGLRQWDTMLRGTPEQVQDEAREAIQQTKGRRLILGTGCVTPITTPHSHLLAARRVVEA